MVQQKMIILHSNDFFTVQINELIFALIVDKASLSSEASPNKLPTKGILYMKEEDDWVPFYFMLAETKMTYTEGI